MKPSPKSQLPTPEYPVRSAYESTRREFILRVSQTAVGIGLAALALPVLGDPPAQAETDAAAFDPKVFGKQLDELARLLGSDDFRKRKEATAALIALGKGDGTDPVLDEKRRTLILEKMTALQKAKDPEIAERARAVILALQPKPVIKPQPPVELEGDVAIDVQE